MEEFAYYVSFHDKKSSGYNTKIFARFSDIEKYTTKGTRITIERIPFESSFHAKNNRTILADGTSVDLEPGEPYGSPVVASARPRHDNVPGCKVNASGAVY